MFFKTIKKYSHERLNTLYQKFILFKFLDLMESRIYGYYLIFATCLNVYFLPFLFHGATSILSSVQKDIVTYIKAQIENISIIMDYGLTSMESFYVLLNTLLTSACSLFWVVSGVFFMNAAILYVFDFYYKKRVDPDQESFNKLLKDIDNDSMCSEKNFDDDNISIRSILD